MKLSGSVAGITPSTGVANMVLESASSTQIYSIQDVMFGGEVTSSTAMRTTVARDSVVGNGTRTAASVQRLDQTLTTPGNAAFCSTTYATTQPTIQAGALLMFAWNANGGFIRWLAAPGEELVLTGLSSIEMRAALGTAQSSYEWIWTEF